MYMDQYSSSGGKSPLVNTREYCEVRRCVTYVKYSYHFIQAFSSSRFPGTKVVCVDYDWFGGLLM